MATTIATTPTAAALDTPATAASEMPTVMIEALTDASNDLDGARKGPGGKHDNMRTYSPEEAALVFQFVEAHAPRWTHIAKLVTDAFGQPRTAASIRNYYKRFQASKAIAERDSATRKLNRCQVCGQIKRGHICKAQTLEYSPPDGATNDASSPAAASPSAESAPAPAAPATAKREAPEAAAEAPPAKRLALACDGEDVPPLAAASLEVIMPNGSPYHDSLSTPAPVSANFLNGLLAPSPFSFTPALPPSAGGASAPFAFSRPRSVPVCVDAIGTDEILEVGEAGEGDPEGTEVEVSRAPSSLA